MARIIKEDFYRQNTKKVAQELLGKILVHKINGQVISGRITETEAYLGIKDPAAHTYNGRRTQRNEAMYLAGGHAYIYFVYGMHFCFNVVTRTENVPEAVLIRSLEPLEGIELMKLNRKLNIIKNLSNGPGKLCQALGITRDQNKLCLQTSSLQIWDDGFKFSKKDILVTPRIGIGYAGEAVDWPLRFLIKK